MISIFNGTSAQDSAFLGPENGDTAIFDYTKFEGSGIVKYGVEGIPPGAMADVTVTWQQQRYYGGPFVDIASDTARIRVTPFFLADHSMSVSSSGESVLVGDYDTDNQELRTALSTKYGSSLDEVGSPDNNDPWHQDGYEVGYVCVPCVSMPVFLVSPRAYETAQGADQDLAKYAHNHRLEKDVGVCWALEYIAPGNTQDSFGNLECRPADDKLFCGGGMTTHIKDFFEAQGVNPRLEVNTSWLHVEHVDEVVSFAPNGCTVVADPEVCLGLLIWIWSDRYGDPDRLDTYVADSRPLWYIMPINRDLNIETVMHPDNLPAIRNALSLPSPEQVTVGSSGSGALTKAGAFIGYFGDSQVHKFKVIFRDSSRYRLQYWDGNDFVDSDMSQAWGAEHAGSWTYVKSGTEDDGEYISANHDCIFKDAKCFILKTWWDGSFEAGNTFEFEANPTCTTIEMPVYFEPDTAGAVACTVNHVNSLVDGETVFTGETHEQGTGDRLKDYVQIMFGKAGYSTITMADSLYYHTRNGDIHCGTNVRR